MPVLTIVCNPFDPASSSTSFDVEAGSVISACKDASEMLEYEDVAVSIVGIGSIHKSQCDCRPLKDGESVVIAPIIEGEAIWAIGTWIASNWQTVATVASLASAAYALTVSPPSFESPNQGDPVYFVSGQRNQIKLAEPIESPYGRNKLFPSYAAKPYNRFQNNDQYIYQLFCLGHGQYDIEGHFIEDTSIASFQDVDLEVYEPGDPVTLFPDNIVTSSEVSSIEMFGPNQDDYAGYIGPFVANSVGTQTNVLEWDVVFPRGLYTANSDGTFANATTTLNFQYREIDDSGTAIGSWNSVAFSKTLKTNTPQRFTVTQSVSLGRYEVQAARTNNASTDTSVVDTAQWYQLRSILPSTKDYGDVTLVAIKARASNNLNDQSRSRYNCIATRKLPIYDGSSWSTPTTTRNPVWAFCDVLKALYGGNLADSKLYLSALKTLADGYDSRSEYFDWVFDQPITIWEAMKLVARAGRAAPVASINRFSMIRDEARSVPVMAFGPDNIVRDSFSLDVDFQSPDDYDGVEIEYLDATTWKQETVECLIGNDAGINTQKIRLPGVTDRNRAYREGLYVRSQQIYQREVATFQSELEGIYPTFGDLIAVNHDVPRWGVGGIVESIAEDGQTVVLSEPVGESVGNSIAFRDKYGAVTGPYSCSTSADDPYTVFCSSVVDQTLLRFDEYADSVMFFFGPSSAMYRDMIVSSVSLSDDDKSTIRAINYDSRVYGFDSEIAPAIGSGSVPVGVPDLPEVGTVLITVDATNATKGYASWPIALGASYYVVERSYDGTNYDNLGVTNVNYLTFELDPGLVYIRVAGVNSGQGPWSVGSSTIGSHTRVDSNNNRRVDSDGNVRISR